MSGKEVRRPGLLKGALAGHVSNAQGAAVLHLSIRQFQRLKGRYRAEGARRPAPPAARQLKEITHGHRRLASTSRCADRRDLILIMPRLLNYIVAIYLIVIGLLGLTHR